MLEPALLVYYTHDAPGVGSARLRERFRVRVNERGGTPSHEQIVAAAADAHALCFFVPDLIDRALIASLPELRVLAGYGKGFDNVDVAAATERGIWVTNVPDALTEATADLAWALMLGIARNVARGDAAVRARDFDGWQPDRLLGANVSGKRLGLLGFGAIGRAMARRAVGFAMEVVYFDIEPAAPDVESEFHVRYAPFDEVLRDADYVVVLMPLTDSTRGALGAAELARMRPSAFLINPSRGSIVDERAVAAALAAQRIAGYASDVFAFEDRQYADRPTYVDAALLADFDRTLFTPHLGTAVLEARLGLAQSQARSVEDALSGRRPYGAVNDVCGGGHRAAGPRVVR